MKILQWLDARIPIMSFWKRQFTEYYVPRNLNMLYYFGVIALVVLGIQLLSGLWLTMFYTPTIELAFASIESIMRDVNYGWLLRYMHSTGASALFMVMYLHLFRGLLYGSYQKPRELVWILGMGLFVLLMVEAFFGYILPWGQMSYWGAEVVTSLFGSIPWVGKRLVEWVRGDYSVSNSTLQRFFALHVIGLILLVLLGVLLHLVALRHVGSNNPEGIEIYEDLDEDGKPVDGVSFYPYYVKKDVLAILVFLFVFFAVVFFTPDMGGYFLEPNNFIPANPLVTPEHIAPIWYLAPFFAILRSIPNTFLGIVIMFSSLFILFLVPWLDKSKVKSMRYKGAYSRLMLALMVVSFIILGWIGTEPMTPMRKWLAKGCTVLYFAYFLLMPLYSRFEAIKVMPRRIRSPLPPAGEG